MARVIFVYSFMFLVLSIASCKKDNSSCADLSVYAQNQYVMRDSVVFRTDSVVIVADTIIFLPVSGGKYFINYLMPDKIFLVPKGCANNFILDTASYGSGFTYTGIGQISNNGENISMQVHRTSYFNPADSARYYCSGVKL